MSQRLIAAEEWFGEIIKRGLVFSSNAEDDCKLVRDIQRNALEAAAGIADECHAKVKFDSAGNLCCRETSAEIRTLLPEE